MLLDYDLLVSDAHVLHRVRQVQVHVCHGVASQLIVGDVIAFYVELEVLSFQPPLVKFTTKSNCTRLSSVSLVWPSPTACASVLTLPDIS